MVKTLASYVREFKKVSFLTPVCMIGEVIMEMLIPMMMASIIDDGVNKGDMEHIYRVGILMIADCWPACWEASSAPGRPPALPGICGRECLTIFSPFPSPT